MVIRWIVLGIFVVIGLFFLKMEHHTRKLKVLILVALGFVIYFSLMGMLNSEDVDVNSPKGIVGAVYTYFGWVGETGARLFDIGKNTVSLVGNAVKVNVTDIGFNK